MNLFKLFRKKKSLEERIKDLEEEKFLSLVAKDYKAFVSSSLALGILKNELMGTTKVK